MTTWNRIFLFIIALVAVAVSPSAAGAEDRVVYAGFSRPKGLRPGASVFLLGNRVGKVVALRRSDETSDLGRPYILELAVTAGAVDQLVEKGGAVAIVSASAAEGDAPVGVSVELVPSSDGAVPPKRLEGFGSFEEYWLADAKGSPAPKH